MQNLKPLASLYSWAGQFESYPEDRFSRGGAPLFSSFLGRIYRSRDDIVPGLEKEMIWT